MNLTLAMTGDDDWYKGLEDLNDFSVPLERCGIEMLSSIDLNFAAEGRPTWKPLAPSTLQQRRMQGKDAKVLQDTGRLHQSFQRGQEGNVFEASPTEIEVGTNLPYAVYQEDGTKPYVIKPLAKKALYWAGAGASHPVRFVNHPGLVARPMAVVQPEDLETFGMVMADWLEDEL